MEQQHVRHIEVVHSGCDYLDSIVADMERQVAEMEARAAETDIPSVLDGYEKFIAVLQQCIDTLQAKSQQLRHQEH